MSMRILYLYLVFFLFITCLPGHASDLSFSYSYRPAPEGFNLELHELNQKFTAKGFESLSANPTGTIGYIHADEVLTKPNHSGLIMVKTGLIAPAHLRFKILRKGNLSLYHTDSASVAFFDFSEQEVIKLTATLRPTITSRIFNTILPTAQAGDMIVCQNEKHENFSDLEKIGQKVSQTLLVKKIGECATHALRGAEGKIEETKEFFTKLLHNPGKLWSEMKENFTQLKQFITNITSELQSFYKTIADLSLQDQLDIACKLTGEMIPQLALAATGAGLGVATTKILMSTLPKLQRLKRLLEYSKRHGLSSEVAKESLSCAI